MNLAKETQSLCKSIKRGRVALGLTLMTTISPMFILPQTAVAAKVKVQNTIQNNLEIAALEVNGEKISLGEYEMTLFYKYSHMKPSDYKRDLILLQSYTIEEIIKNNVISQHAEQLKVTLSDKDLTDYRDSCSLDKRIDQNAFEVVSKKQLLDWALKGEYAKEYPATDSELQTFYKEEQDRFYIPGEIKFAYIKLSSKTKNELTAEELESLIKKASEIRDLIKPDSNFSEFAKQYSEDKNHQEPGEFIKQSSIDNDLFSVASALETNEVSGLKECSNGFYIVKLFDKIPSSVKPFSEVKTEIEESVKYIKSEIKMKNDVKEWIKEAKVTKFDDVLNSVDIKKFIKSRLHK